MTPPGLSAEFLREHQICDWGYTEASAPESLERYNRWVEKGLHGPLGYLADHRQDLRSDVKNVFPDFQSAVVFLFDYTQERKRLQERNPKNKIASYVSGFEGIDYHYWIKNKFDLILEKMKSEVPGLKGFYSIDAQPVLERDLAYRAGLGWFGKNSMLISRKHGSYFIIGSLLLNKKLELQAPENFEPDHCGNCSACIDACPTNAILGDRTIDAQKCVSSYTIELFKDAEPPKGYPSQSNEIFGCDICQDVCPWNKKPLANAEFSTSEGKDWLNFFDRTKEEILQDLENMSNRGYRKKFAETPLERTGRLGIMKNLDKLKS